MARNQINTLVSIMANMSAPFSGRFFCCWPQKNTLLTVLHRLPPRILFAVRKMLQTNPIKSFAMNRKLLALSLLSTVAFASCDPADVTPTPDPTPAPPATSSPTFSDGDGAIIALVTRTSTSTPMGNVDIDLGTGVAVFGNLSTGAYTNAGNVTLNGKALKRNENNSYVYVPSMTDVTGIDLSSNIKWVVETPSFTYDAATSGRDMPVASGAISFTGASLNASEAFTLSVSGSINNADSVYFQINGPSKSILKRMGGSTTSVTFTAAEMGSLGKSAGCSMTIAPWNHEQKTLGGKTIHIVNELALSKVVEIK